MESWLLIMTVFINAELSATKPPTIAMVEKLPSQEVCVQVGEDWKKSLINNHHTKKYIDRVAKYSCTNTNTSKK